MRRLFVLPAALLVLGVSGCTFVHLTPGASAVQVLSAAPVGCVKRGEVTVSVKDRLGPYQRSDSQVRDELETLARNEAPGLAANRISPLTPPRDGEQQWLMWRCGR